MIPHDAHISLRPVADGDLEFLYRLYASTRQEEKELAGWPDEQWDGFLRMQFNLQHTQYMKNYEHPSFDIVMSGEIPVGRLYVNRRRDEIRLIDIAILPEFRGRGIAAGLVEALLLESEGKCLPVSLHVEKNNPILEYYLRLGFRIEEDKGVYFFMVRPCKGAESLDHQSNIKKEP